MLTGRKRRYPFKSAKSGPKKTRSAGTYTGRVPPSLPRGVGRPAVGFVRTGGFYGRFQPSGQELKYHDTILQLATGVDTGIYTSNGTTAEIDNVAQGTGANERIGRKITVKSISGRIAFTVQDRNYIASTGVYNNVQFMLWLVLDKQCNGALASPNDIFDPANTFRCLRNMQYSDRFQILNKWIIDMGVLSTSFAAGGTTVPIVVGGTKTIDIYKKVNIPIEYSNSTGATTEIRSNHLFFVWGTNGFANNTVSDDSPIVGGIRIRYSDS